MVRLIPDSVNQPAALLPGSFLYPVFVVSQPDSPNEQAHELRFVHVRFLFSRARSSIHTICNWTAPAPPSGEDAFHRAIVDGLLSDFLCHSPMAYLSSFSSKAALTAVAVTRVDTIQRFQHDDGISANHAHAQAHFLVVGSALGSLVQDDVQEDVVAAQRAHDFARAV